MQISKPALLLSSLLSLTASCTAIFVPDEDNDGVIRCDTVSDCKPPIGNNHFSYECVRGNEQSENSPKVCAPSYTQVKCNPGSFGKDSDYANYFAKAMESSGYGNSCEMTLGKEGCPPNAGMCDPGLERNAQGICHDPDADYLALYLSEGGEDVKHQFCSWYFCSDEFICSPTGFCELCDPNAEIDEEGSNSNKACVKYFVAGAPSPVYLGEGQCNKDGKTKPSEAKFGDVP